MSDGESAEELLRRWRSGDQGAADELYRRYAQRLCLLAEAQIDRRFARRFSPEDVVQSVFRTFFRRGAKGEFSVDHSGALWNLLVVIALNKMRKLAERHGAGKRDVDAEVSADGAKPRPEAVAHEPTPEEAAALADELELVLSSLALGEGDMVRLCLAGYSTTEIAKRLGCSRWTVRRVLDRAGCLLRKRL